MSTVGISASIGQQLCSVTKMSPAARTINLGRKSRQHRPSGRTSSLLISVSLTILGSIWLAALTLPEPGSDAAAIGPTVYLRLRVDPPHKYRIQLEQSADASDSHADHEYFSINLLDTETRGIVPIRGVDIARSALSSDGYMDCSFGSKSSSRADLNRLRAAYEKVRPTLVGHYADRLVRADTYTALNPDSWQVSCAGTTPIVDLKQATNVVTPTQFVVEIVGAHQSDVAIVEPRYFFTAPSSWVRANSDTVVVQNASEPSTDSSYSPNLPYLVSPLGASYVFVDPARQRWIDITSGLLLLVGGATIAVALEWIAQRASQRGRETPVNAEQFRARFRRRAQRSGFPPS